jgi:hypothetical protein
MVNLIDDGFFATMYNCCSLLKAHACGLSHLRSDDEEALIALKSESEG